MFGSAVWMTVESEKSGHLRISDEHNVATVSAGTTVRPSQRLEFFAANGGTAVSTISGTQVQRDVVNECGHVPLLQEVERNFLGEKQKGEPELAPLQVNRRC
jgi:putative heme iron utilization protein